MDSELAHGRVNKLLLKIAINLELNLIVKTSSLLLWIWFTLKIGMLNPL